MLLVSRRIQEGCDDNAEGGEEESDQVDEARRPEGDARLHGPELIKAVKDAAEAADQKAWQFVERAVPRH